MARPDRPGFPGPRNLRPTEAYPTFPIISAVDPASDRITGGASITITGERFVDGASVYFGDVPGENVVVVNSTTITVDAPAQDGEGTVDIFVTNPNGEFGTFSQGFTYIEGHITGVSVNKGPTAGGTSLSIFGVNLVAGSTIEFDGEPAVDVVFVDETQYRCVTPEHDDPGLIDIVIFEPGGSIVTGKKLFGYTSKIFLEDIRRSPSLSVQESTNGGVNSATFKIDGFGVPPAGGERTSFADKEGNTVFAGQVTGLTLTHEGSRTARCWTATASGWEWRFNKRRAFGVYNNVSATDVAIDIVERYCPGFTTTFIQQRLPRISLVLDGSLDNTTILTQICEKLGFGKCYIDNDRNVHLFVPPFDPPSPPTGALGFGAAAMTVTESGVATTGYPSFQPGYWQFYSTFKYGASKTYTVPHASISIPPSPGYVLVSDQARDLNLIGNTSNGSYGLGFKRGWIMYDVNGVQIGEGWAGHQPPVAGDVVFATQDVATVLEEKSGGGTFETRLSALSGPIYLSEFLPTFDDIPIGPMNGTRDCTSREIYAVRYGEIADAITPPDPVVTVAALINPTEAPEAENGVGSGAWGSGAPYNVKFAYSYSGSDSLAGVTANTTALSPFSAIVTPIGNRIRLQAPYSTDPGCKNVVFWISRASDGYSTVRTYTNVFVGDDAALIYQNNPAGGMIDAQVDGTGLSAFFDDVPGFVNRSSGSVITTRQVGSALQHYYSLLDNVTTGPITPEPEIRSAKVAARSTTPPLAPITIPTASESSTAIDETQPLESEGQIGYWAFRITGLYKDGTESRGTEQTAPVLLTGLLKSALTNIPTFPDVGGVPCVARVVYAAVYEPTDPLEYGIPSFSIANSRKVAFILDNTSSSAEVQFGTSIVGGERKYNNLPPGAEDELGPNLESTTDPNDVDDNDEYLLLDPAVSLSVDLTQLRNRVFVKGKGTILAQDGAVGDRSLRVLDTSAFSPTGGKLATGHLVIDYKSVTSAVGNQTIVLTKPLTQPLLQADWKFGGGTPVRPVVIVEDLQSQAFFAYVEIDDDGEPSDGVHEYMLIDDKLSTQLQMFNAGVAELKAAWPIREVRYSTRDPKSRKGRSVHFDLSDPPIFGDFVITDVSIDQYYDESDTLTPRYNVTATTVSRVTLHDYLKMIGAPREEFNGFGGTIDTAIAVSSGDDEIFPSVVYANIIEPLSLSTPDCVEVGVQYSPAGVVAFDSDEVPAMVGTDGAVTDKKWATMASTTVLDSAATMSFNVATCHMERNLDIWMHVRTPKNLSNIILWAGCIALTTNMARANTPNNACQFTLRYANYFGGVPTVSDFNDSGWTLTLRPIGASHKSTNIYIAPIAVSTEYLLRIQTRVDDNNLNNARVRATVNGVMKEVSWDDTFNGVDHNMPIGDNISSVGMQVRLGVINKIGGVGTTKKFSFSRMSMKYNSPWEDD